MGKPARLIVISDLHLGGESPAMMSHPKELGGFISGLPGRLAPDEALDLVIAGDFVDFLSEPPLSPWTPDPGAALPKLLRVMGAQGSGAGFSPVFDALGAHVAAGHRLTVMLGNHDLELTLPPLQEALLRRLGADPHQVLFVMDGRAYRVGGALIEHGNRYDDANANDFTHLRALASFLSRGEAPNDEATVTVSTGSQLVTRVVSPLKRVYPFVDLLKPEGELLAYLIFALEPSLVGQYMGDFKLLFEAQRKAAANAEGKPPGATENVAGETFLPDEELRGAFPEMYDAIRQRPDNVGFGDLFSGFFDSVLSDSISQLVKANRPIPKDRLAKIRLSLRRLLAGDRSFDLTAPDGPYASAAARLLQLPGVETVVMGHTHLARQYGAGPRATYVNTGTWADLVRVPDAVLADGADDALSKFLADLVHDSGVRWFHPTFADLRVNADGHVERASVQQA
jgi:UDP-2,3-diacylglucosamine pyrophosphatase LpxH